MSKEPSWPPAWPPCLASLSPGQPCVRVVRSPSSHGTSDLRCKHPRSMADLFVHFSQSRKPVRTWTTDPAWKYVKRLILVSQHQYLVIRDMRYECSSLCCVISRAIVTATDTSTISVRDLDFGKRHQSVGSQHIERNRDRQSISVLQCWGCAQS